MAYFTQEYLDFFTELELNNHKEWFDSNRKRYEEHVREPFKVFVQDLIDASRAVHPELEATVRESMMRINRDIRFSKDKTPYKIHMGAGVSPGGKKNYAVPGMFVQANHVDVRLYSGVYELEKEQLQSLREHIAAHSEELNELISTPEFAKHYGSIRGDQNKRVSKELMPAAAVQPLILHKNFYYFTSWPPSVLLQDDLIALIMDRYQVATPLNEYLLQGIFPDM